MITTDIIREIAQADVILADLTGNNANVFYELGVAQAAGKPVVITCRRGTDLPFDVKLHRVIFYELHTHGIQLLKEEVVKYLSKAVTESHEMDFVFEHVHGRRMLIERRLNMAVITIAEASKLRIRDVGMHLYLAESDTILRRAARDTIRSVASTPQSDRWPKGEGVVGTCWAMNEKVVVDLQEPRYSSMTEPKWQLLPDRVKFGRTYEQFQVAKRMFIGIAAVPLRRGERLSDVFPSTWTTKPARVFGMYGRASLSKLSTAPHETSSTIFGSHPDSD